MPRPLPYQSPLPPGHRLRREQFDGTTRISRDVVSAGMLWREAISFIVTFSLFGGMFCLSIHWFFSRLNAPPGVLIFTVACTVASGLLWVVITRFAWLNTGIVTEVAVSAESLYWRKQNVWGAREYFWPLDTIRSVAVESLSLKIRRFKGLSISAFAFVPRGELDLVAAALNDAIASSRSVTATLGEDRPAKTPKGGDGFIAATITFLAGATVLRGVIESIRDGVIPSRYHRETPTRETDPFGFWFDIIVGFGIAIGMMYAGARIAIDRWRRGREEKKCR